MANVLVQESSLQSIASAIRAKNGTQNTYKPSQMAEAIENIPSGGITPTGTVNITTNGTHDVTNYASANVDVPAGTTPTGTKQISITQNGTTTEDVSAYANAEITVNVPSSGGGTVSGTFTGDGTKNLSIQTGFSPAHVNIYAIDSEFGTDTAWNTNALMYNEDDEYRYEVARYSATNVTTTRVATSSGVTYADGTFSISGLRYPTRSGKTYYWIAM